MTHPLKPIDTLFIPEARFIREDGTTRFVQPALPGEFLRPGRVAYDREAHRGKLKCPHCDIRVDFNKGSGAASCGANVRGSRPHFKKAPGQNHAADCKLPKLLTQASRSVIDEQAGYRIHLNVAFSGLRGPGLHPDQTVYSRAPGGKVIANDERLQPVLVDGVKTYREAVAVKNVGDLIALMERGNFKRLKDSLVVNNVVVPWRDFAILDDNRLRALVERLKNGASHPVLMKVGFYKGVDGDVAASQKVFARRAHIGNASRSEFIIPHIYLDGPGTADAFPARGTYLVLGVPRLHFNRASGAHIVNLSLKNAAFVAPYFHDRILAAARVHDTRRAGPAFS